MVTANPEHGATDLDNDLIMPRSIRHVLFLVTVLGLSAPLAAQQTGTAVAGETNSKPLNLSLPREAATSPDSTPRQDSTLHDNQRTPAQPVDANDKATTERRQNETRSQRLDAPYGTGFEARQRGLGGRGFGGGFGGGRGMGRGR
jgi:hypothetical protein